MQKVNISMYQKRFWLEWKLNPKSISYNTPLIFEFVGDLSINALKNALEVFIHYFDEGCRSFFTEENFIVKQVILDKISVDLEVKDLSNSNIENYGLIKSSFIKSITDKVFDLEQLPLHKFGLLKLSTDNYILVLNFHHIISDAVTANNFIKTISKLYNKYLEGAPFIDYNPLIKFDDYIKYEQLYTSEQKKIDLDYWENLLQNTNLTFNIPILSRELDNTSYAKSTFFHFEEKTTSQIKKLARKHNSSLFIILVATYGLLLLRNSNQNSVVLTYPVNMRPSGFRDKTGCFVNNVLFKVDVLNKITFSDLLLDLTSQRKNTKNHQRCSFTDIIKRLREHGLLTCQKFFNVDFCETYLGVLPLEFKGVETSARAYKSAELLSDISLAYQNNNGIIEFRLEYNSKQFTDSFIHSFIKQFNLLINNVIQDINFPILNSSLLSADEFKNITQNWNDTYIEYDCKKSVCQLFEEISEAYPEKIAVKYLDKVLTYKELNEKANQLAHNLIEFKVSTGQFVGIYITRSIEMIIGILGILKTGAAYVPLDPKAPIARTHNIINNSGLSCILSLKYLYDSLSELKLNVICLDVDWVTIEQYPKNNLPELRILNSPAYLIYTSGSTGDPKGVLINHYSLLNHNLFAKQFYEIKAQDNILQFSTINFDISVEEIFPTIISGATLVLYPDSIGLSLETFEKLLIDSKITVINLPTSFWHLWVNELTVQSISKLKKLRLVVVGGEQPNYNVLLQWKELVGNDIEWINTYGPTEGTIISSVWKSSDKAINKLDTKQLPIGRPISNCKLYVTDEYMNPVPIGVIGELYIEGTNLAIGYLNNPKITAEKFIPNPFSNQPGSRLYSTGDLVRYLDDGNIEYIGRVDQQIKIRGFRVELGEIEAVLKKHFNIRESVVIAHNLPKVENYLVAYILLFNKELYDLHELKNYLAKILPEYMVPKKFIVMDRFHLTLNGKIDKSKLSNFKFDDTEIILPANDTEKQLLTIWQDILGLEKISIHDSFFELGGNSLLILKMHKEIEEKFNKNTSITKLFEYTNIKTLSNYIDSNEENITIIDESTHTKAKRQRLALEKNYLSSKRRKLA